MSTTRLLLSVLLHVYSHNALRPSSDILHVIVESQYIYYMYIKSRTKSIICIKFLNGFLRLLAIRLTIQCWTIVTACIQ
uniref:Secreted protein n=1 Tax=Trichogramma kaykai TaxID=54128 RepID=A0ABD2WHK6_9HYME